MTSAGRSFTAFFVFAGILSGFFLSCAKSPESGERVSGNIVFTPEHPGQDSGRNIADYSYGETEEKTPKVPVNSRDAIIQILDVNLDLDRFEEQILVLKDRNSPDSPIRIVVADFDTVRNSYVVAWEGETSSTNIRSFNLSLLDMIGDHNTEIVCTGINSRGDQTIDVFRRSGNPRGFGLYFTNILSLSVDGSIEIIEEARSQAYQNGLANGSSYPVSVTRPDTDSENTFDLLKEIHHWRPQQANYVLMQREKIPGKEIEDNRLRELYRSGEEAFEKHLTGPWKLSSPVDGKGVGRNPILFFDPITRQITLYSDHVQELYSWENSHKFLSNSLIINGRNEIIPYMRIQITSNLTELNSIRVTIYDLDFRSGRRTANDSWSGTYFKLTPDMQNSLLRRQNNNRNNEALPVLSGFYRGDTGDDISFDSPHFTLRRIDGTLSGVFSLYTMGVPILELKILDHTGLVKESIIYKIDYMENQRQNEIIRTLVLIQGKVGVSGFSPSGEDFIRFEQTELIVEESNSED